MNCYGFFWPITTMFFGILTVSWPFQLPLAGFMCNYVFKWLMNVVMINFKVNELNTV